MNKLTELKKLQGFSHIDKVRLDAIRVLVSKKYQTKYLDDSYLETAYGKELIALIIEAKEAENDQ